MTSRFKPEEIKKITKEIGVKNKRMSFWLDFLENADYDYIKIEIGCPEADIEDIISHLDYVFGNLSKYYGKKSALEQMEIVYLKSR